MMVKDKLEVYKCSVCGNVVEVLFVGGGELICCGKPMVLQAENTVDAAREKHVPVIEITPEGVKIKVGAAAHPMEDKHYIMWVQAIVGDKAYRQFLNPGQAPEAIFPIKADKVIAREYCNLHGLWKAEG